MPKIIIALGIAIACLFSACRDYTVPWAPRPLDGDYEGIYRYQELADTIVGPDGWDLTVNDSQFVLVTVDSQYFRMVLDTSKTKPVDRIACDARANYRIEGMVMFWYEDELPGPPDPDGAETCALERYPEGAFGLSQPADSLILVNQVIQSASGHKYAIRKILRLKRL